MAVIEALHTVVMKVSQEEGRLLMSIIALSSLLRQVHPNRGADDSVQLLPLVCLICFWSIFILNWVDLTLDYEIVLHLLLPKVEVRTVEPP